MDIAKRIKTLREEHGLTQEQLAKELSISRNAISNYENGVRRPDLDLVTKMCDIFRNYFDDMWDNPNYVDSREGIAEELINYGQQVIQIQMLMEK